MNREEIESLARGAEKALADYRDPTKGYAYAAGHLSAQMEAALRFYRRELEQLERKAVNA